MPGWDFAPLLYALAVMAALAVLAAFGLGAWIF